MADPVSVVNDTTWLTAVEPFPSGDWKSLASEILDRAGLQVDPRRGSVRAWAATVKEPHVPGVELSRLSLGGRRAAIAITPRTIFLNDDGTSDNRPASEITRGNQAPAIPAKHQLAEIANTIQVLTGHLQVSVVAVRELKTEPTIRRVGSEAMQPTASLNAAYREFGFDSVPSDWAVTICPIDGTTPNMARAMAQRFIRAAEARRAHLITRIASSDDLRHHASDVERGRGSLQKNTVVLFLAPDKESDLSADSLSLLENLDRLGVRYRRAYVNDPWDFSVPDQLPSLLQAAGGRPHRVDIRVGERSVWSVGLDLSHHTQNSSLAVTLVSPNGELVRAWTTQHRRDETIDVGHLTTLLGGAAQTIREFGTAEDVVLILRDGRLFENERAEMYLRPFTHPVGLVEVRKYRTPLVMVGPHPALAPSAFEAAGGMIFLSCTPPRTKDILPSQLRVRLDRSTQIRLEPRDVAQALIDLAAAPGLGMQRYTLPAPIYWADGIAGASDSDLRFRGSGALVHLT